jgi:hypothetical protein
MNKAEQKHVDAVATVGCVICREFEEVITPCEIHHIGEGSGERSNWMIAGLCYRHHRIGETSLHGAGVKQFLRMYKLHTEYHLLELINKYRAIDELYRR